MQKLRRAYTFTGIATSHKFQPDRQKNQTHHEP
jgi:hypothetical protein